MAGGLQPLSISPSEVCGLLTDHSETRALGSFFLIEKVKSKKADLKFSIMMKHSLLRQLDSSLHFSVALFSTTLQFYTKLNYFVSSDILHSSLI